MNNRSRSAFLLYLIKTHPPFFISFNTHLSSWHLALTFFIDPSPLFGPIFIHLLGVCLSWLATYIYIYNVCWCSSWFWYWYSLLVICREKARKIDEVKLIWGINRSFNISAVGMKLFLSSYCEIYQHPHLIWSKYHSMLRSIGVPIGFLSGHLRIGIFIAKILFSLDKRS